MFFTKRSKWGKTKQNKKKRANYAFEFNNRKEKNSFSISISQMQSLETAI